MWPQIHDESWKKWWRAQHPSTPTIDEELAESFTHNEIEAAIGGGRRRTSKPKSTKPKATKSKVVYKGSPHTVYSKDGKKYVKVLSKASGTFKYVPIK